MVLQMELKEGNSQYNSANYDGYMYYQEMPWTKPTVVNTGRGLLQSIPDEGYAGWVCYYKGEIALDRYQCKSVFVDKF